jgi:hypothetical protein
MEELRKEAFGTYDKLFKIIQCLEVKINECIKVTTQPPKYIVMTTSMGRMMMPDPSLIKAPPIAYKGIKILYVLRDELTEPLVCW